MIYGLIGYPLGHSFSPAYFGAKFARERINAQYKAFPLERIGDLPMLLLQHPDLRGLNVTTPHKQAVIPYLDALSDDARDIGAVNCILANGGRLTGYNTDWTGFRDSLQPLLRPRHNAALVLGNGGAARAVKYALQRLGMAFQTVSRHGDGVLRYEQLSPAMLSVHTVIVNTTILGTGGEGLPDLPYDAVTPDHLLYDLVYNPPLSPFLSEGLKRGAVIKNGQEMLELQAEASWRIWQ